MPRSREARGALVTSWLVLCYVLIQVVASMSWQVDASWQGARHAIGLLLTLAMAITFVRLQRCLLQQRTPSYFTALRWAVLVLGVVLLPLSDAWAPAGISFATLMLFFPLPQVLLVGVTMTALIEGVLWIEGTSWVALLGVPMIVWLAGGVMVVLTRMAVVLEELLNAREHIARLQVDEERHRISRTLHDILGRTLVAASLRTQTALRLVERDPTGCRSQLDQIAATLSEGQSQLRVLVRGETVIGLETEITTAVDLFERLGIECDVSTGLIGDAELELLAATVLREAITNMLKHSRPAHVTIEVADGPDAAVLTVVNDGAGDATAGRGGTGLREIAQRLEAVGGSLEARPAPDGRFAVVARLPHPTRGEDVPGLRGAAVPGDAGVPGGADRVAEAGR